jgi:hypothetical protein
MSVVELKSSEGPALPADADARDVQPLARRLSALESQHLSEKNDERAEAIAAPPMFAPRKLIGWPLVFLCSFHGLRKSGMQPFL